MKKSKFLPFVAALALIGLGSCTDALVTSTPVYVDLLPKATISGYVTADLNLQNYGKEFAPVDTKLLVEVNYADINPAATAGKWKDTVTVTADGKYSVSVPTDASGVTVTITPFSFEADQIQPYNAFYQTVKMVYSSSKTNVAIVAGQSVVQNIDFTASSLPTFTDKVRVSGKIVANLNSEIIGNENVPDNTVINFYNNTWKDSVKVINGTYSIVVPKGVTVAWICKFNYSKRVWSQSSLAYNNVNYLYSISGSNSFGANVDNNDLTGGEGTDLTVDPNANIVVVSGTAQADTDLTLSGNENIPDNTKVYFTSSAGDWGAAANVLNGRYTVSIPKNKTVNYTTTFTANKKISNVSFIPTTYTASGTISATSVATYSLNINAN